ncbi:MAG: hypothetical protein QM504_05540 [Pseudomonadota bacterium]
MDSSNNLHIVLATAEPKVVNRLLNSIQQALPSFKVTASVLLFGMTESIQHFELCMPVDVIDSFMYYLPIVDSRNICQLHLYRKMKRSGGIGFIFDDDLSWTLSENDFITLIDELKMNGCDMAFSALSGDSPIPKEYTRTSPLLDVLMAINDEISNDETVLINEYVKGIKTSDEGVADTYAHHDFYSFNPSRFHRYNVNLATIQWHDFINRLIKGKTTTRSIQLPTKVTPASGRERGGATLILNPDVLLCQNKALRCIKWISRRSDMIMATDAKNYNFKLFNTPPMLEHRRDESFDTHDNKKLIGDILGYALVESRNASKYCQNKFLLSLSQRIDQTNLLLKESSKMMKLLDKWLVNNNYIGSEQSKAFNSMILENEQTMFALMSIDLNIVLESFKEFDESRANIVDVIKYSATFFSVMSENNYSHVFIPLSLEYSVVTRDFLQEKALYAVQIDY